MATEGLPSSCTNTAPRETDGGTQAPDENCAGSDGKSHSDIFTCGLNSTLFELFAPAGTPHSLGKAKNDEGGWATFQGGGCYCINGNFCCSDAKTCLPLDGSFYNQGDHGPGASEIDWFKSDEVSAGCSCDG